MADTPVAFVSHASEDKARYAEPLAKRLRQLGIDAWLDKWELIAGDRLVDKVFEEGLGKASTVVFLMSPRSIGKPWVMAELENAVIRHIAGELRLIPVMLEPCDVPESVRALLWVNLEETKTIEAAAEVVANAIYGYTEKPPIGAAPLHVGAASLQVIGLDSTEALVLELVYRAALAHGRRFIQNAQLEPLAKEYDLSNEVLGDTIEVLCDQGYLVNRDRTMSQRRIVVELRAEEMLEIAAKLGEPVLKWQCALAGLILNKGVTEIEDIREAMACPRALTDAILDFLDDRELVRVARTMGDGGIVHSPSALFKKWFRGSC